jgi:apolipoprotein N-acyltransferase
MFRTSLITFDPGFHAPAEQTPTPEEIASYGPHDLAAVVSRLGTPVLVGVDRVTYRATTAAGAQQAPADYNSAVLVGRDGKISATYDKLHRVMFGEYIPFANMLPFLYRLTPLSGGIEPGTGPVAFWVNSRYCFAPNICYETAIPHVIRRQVRELARRSEFPIALVNLTNDAWFWGSSELQMHIACDVFRAIETRLPLVVSANGGISAWIDRDGRIREKLPRQQPGFILADLETAMVSSLYVEYGDWFSGICLLFCVVFAASGWRAKRQVMKATRPPQDDAAT